MSTENVVVDLGAQFQFKMSGSIVLTLMFFAKFAAFVRCSNSSACFFAASASRTRSASAA